MFELYALGYRGLDREFRLEELDDKGRLEKFIPSESFPEITLKRIAVEFVSIAVEYSRIVSSIVLDD